jgi:tetratricopeptide (TPR) repeat protein
MMTYYFAVFVLLAQNTFEQRVPSVYRSEITIINTGQPIPWKPTGFDTGPAVGQMLNGHFYPGVNFYNAGRYAAAEPELGYVIARPYYLEGNVHRNEFMSTAHYLLGMIYAHHAEGVGSRSLAIQHFQKAIEWNPNDAAAYLEMANVFNELRLPKEASATIQRLLASNPPEDVAAQARDELSKIPPVEK